MLNYNNFEEERENAVEEEDNENEQEENDGAGESENPYGEDSNEKEDAEEQDGAGSGVAGRMGQDSKNEKEEKDNGGKSGGSFMGRFASKAKTGKDKYNIKKEDVIKEAARALAIPRPDLECPVCKQRSISTEPEVRKLVWNTASRGARSPRFACVNKKCPMFYKKHAIFGISPTNGKLQETIWSKMYKQP